ncbi:serine/threonine-protein kinase [Nonomuraea endophytica]|uniref:non-specific serine/threonine protein kinase n=1 Tax=Nonomuraea endophytica TaxID=714136 RepID=A0A7W8EEN1_9ACTN|nr:serine/threonine-protein kinase [Nonomuraea endophytica]MBB5076749.1 serine/threonine protein kinase [Nonomuraea endophytica]
MDRDPAKLRTSPPSGSPLPEPEPVRLGTRYVRQELIGRGANGQVWRGRRLADDEPVAIKVLKEEYADDPAAVARFLREGVALRSLKHPHLVPVYDLVAEGSTLAIVMELVPGENLRAALGRKVMDRAKSVAVLGHVAQALAAAHAAGIVHRDVKPENVLVTWRGGDPWARLTDFGVAHVADGQTLTKQSTFVGTSQYLAPELAKGEPPTPAADVYALGVMAFELLAGRRPFLHTDQTALLLAHLADEPVRPPEIGDDLWPVIANCLAKDVGRRMGANSVAQAFGAGELPPGVPPPLPPLPRTHFELPPGTLTTSGSPVPIPEPPAEPPTPRRLRWWPVAALAATLLASAGAGIWYGLPDQTKATPTATPGPTGRLDSIPVAVTSPARGRITLDFADASSVPGFRGYVIKRGDTIIDQLSGDRKTTYDIRGLDHTTEHCYSVHVLVLSDQPSPPPAEPACRAADGRGPTD